MPLNRFPKVAAIICCLLSYCSAYAESTIYDNVTGNTSMCDEIPRMECPQIAWLKPGTSEHPDRTGYPNVDGGAAPGCADPIVTYSDDVDIINVCHYVITRTWRAENPDNSNLYTECDQTIKVVDEEAPIITDGPDDIDVYASRAQCRSVVKWESPVIYDNVLVRSIWILAEHNGRHFELHETWGYFDEGITTITYKVDDHCGNESMYTFKINVMCADCHVVCPDDVVLPLGSDISPDVLGYATEYQGNKDCGIADIRYMDIMVSSDCYGSMSYYRMWTARFELMPDYSFGCRQHIELQADTRLLLSDCPEDIVVEHNGIIVEWEEPLTSSGPNNVVLTSTHTPGNTFPVGITNVTYRATDSCDNEESCSFKVSVLEDLEDDDCPEDFTVECDEPGGTLIKWDPPVYDGRCAECPKGRQIPGFIYVGAFGTSHYYCSKKNYNYEDAKALAHKKGGYIASINSEGENEFVRSYIAGATAMIGLSDYDSEGHFVWDSGETLTYENWYPGQPNDRGGKQDIVEILRSGEWNDVDNDTELEFVMEVPCENVIQLDGPLSGTEVKSGTYTIRYKIADGCGYEEYCEFTVTVDKCKGTRSTRGGLDFGEIEREDEAPQQIAIYPNPVSETLNLELPNIENLTSIQIFSQTGQPIRTFKEVDAYSQIDVSDLDQAVYIVAVNYLNKKPVLQRIIKL